jgi:hypothetical protein
MLETSIEAYAVEQAEERGCLAFKLNNTASDGWPDRYFVTLNGVVFYIEFKQLGEKCRKLQSQRIVELLDHEQIVYVVDNKEDALSVIKYHTPRS